MIDKILSLLNIESFERGATVFRKNPLAAVLVIMSFCYSFRWAWMCISIKTKENVKKPVVSTFKK